jgi:1,4-alpha-glucan branching enzyme
MARLLDDPYLRPYADAIRARAARAAARADALTQGAPSLDDWARAHDYYGLHRTRTGWVFREWAPQATALWLVGDFSSWKTDPRFECRRLPGTDVWECRLARALIRHGDNYRLEMRWPGGGGERIPAYARYVVQDPQTHLFCARVWAPPRPYRWKHAAPARTPGRDVPFIYEAHVGMAGEEEKVSSYAAFRDEVLARIKAAGYDTVQLMAVMEHPYYGSFGYHVSSFFAASSRFGTPDDLKSLIDTAHGMGLRVIMDLVHSHAVKNERDGLSRFDGSDWQYFHAGAKGYHPAWDSRCFDYGKTEVLRFLLSNCRFWLDEYRFDGYRFDGVTSMLYWDRGLGRAFGDYAGYFDGSLDEDAWIYLHLANRVIHAAHPAALTIAEDVSGLPGCAAPAEDGGLGFDYRLAMGEPDRWFALAADVRDDDWPMGGLYQALTDRRAEERVVSYVESHDQALVGGKTFFFQLADAAVYTGMANGQNSLPVERAVALHKMARLATAALSGGAYLTFMGNEFGHPEWIDFPREGNGWSYRHARRQWSLRDDPRLRFKALADFDAQMLSVLAAATAADGAPALLDKPVCLAANEQDKILAFVRGDLLAVFNFNPVRSFENYGILVPPATRWRHCLDTDELRFGGQGRIAAGQIFQPVLVAARGEIVQQIRLYVPARTAVVLKRFI